MPHDKHGRKIERGDVVKAPGSNQSGRIIVGPVVSMSESQSCTGQIRFVGVGQLESDYFNASDSEIVVKADGTLPAVPVAESSAPPSETA